MQSAPPVSHKRRHCRILFSPCWRIYPSVVLLHSDWYTPLILWYSLAIWGCNPPFCCQGIAGIIGGHLHHTVLLAYGIFRWLETVEAHCGYDFPYSPFQGICAGADAHGPCNVFEDNLPLPLFNWVLFLQTTITATTLVVMVPPKSGIRCLAQTYRFFAGKGTKTRKKQCKRPRSRPATADRPRIEPMRTCTWRAWLLYIDLWTTCNQ